MESSNKEFYVPNFGTFAVKTHRGHKVKLNPREDDGEVINLPDYKMLRFKPDEKYKADILMEGEKINTFLIIRIFDNN